MSKEKVDVKELSDTIMDYLNNYSEDIHNEVVEVTEDVTKKAIQELKETSPRGKGKRSKPYHLGWESKIQIKGKNKYHRVIWNKTNYQLTHLLEFGHATKMVEELKHNHIYNLLKINIKQSLLNCYQRKLGGQINDITRIKNKM